MCDYQKYQKYKNLYLLKKNNNKNLEETNDSSKPNYPLLKSISSNNSLSFISEANKAGIPIISLPTNQYLRIPPYQTDIPFSQITFEKDMEDVIKYLKEGYFVNLTLIVKSDGDKHAILLYFDKKLNKIELWDSNGYSQGKKTRVYLETVIGYIRVNIIEKEELDFKISDKSDNNINLLIASRNEDAGHCDALTLLYIILRSQSYEHGQNIYKISWTNNNLGKKNMLLLNAYIKKRDIVSLFNLVGFNDLIFIAKYFTTNSIKKLQNK